MDTTTTIAIWLPLVILVLALLLYAGYRGRDGTSTNKANRGTTYPNIIKRVELIEVQDTGPLQRSRHSSKKSKSSPRKRTSKKASAPKASAPKKKTGSNPFLKYWNPNTEGMSPRTARRAEIWNRLYHLKEQEKALRRRKELDAAMAASKKV